MGGTQLLTTSIPRCKHCGSSLLTKYGKYKGTQLYWCQECGRKIKGDTDPFHMKVPAEYVNTALEWYFRGLSLHEICDHLNQKYGYNPSKHVVFDWVNKFTLKAIRYFNGFRPNVGTIWIAHETEVRVDKLRKVWLWDIIDARTRFLIATRVSVTRSAQDAALLLENTFRKVDQVPDTVITGKSPFLNEELLDTGAKTKYRQGPTLDIRSASYMIGPCHGSVKDRTKVIRPFKDIHSFRKFNDGFRIYYNFLRPHEELSGQTPAEAADIQYQVKSWGSLANLPVIENSQAPSYHESPVIQSPQTVGPKQKACVKVKGPQFHNTQP